MIEHDIMQLDIGGYEFTRQEVTKCSYTEKKWEEFLEDQSILENFKETYTESNEKFKMQKPKRVKRTRAE